MNVTYLVKKDCICYNAKKNECEVLMETVCRVKRKCPFYKNRAMLDRQVDRIRQRLPDYDPNRKAW